MFQAEREANPDGFEFGRLLIRNFAEDSEASSRESSPPLQASVNPSAAFPSSTSAQQVAKLAPIFHQLFEEADAFVYVTDSCKVAEEIEKSKVEMKMARRRQHFEHNGMIAGVAGY